MEQGYARITVCFEAPFWIGVLEREWGGTLEVCKIVFGAEPRDYEVYAFLMSHWRELRFSPPVTGVRRAEAANPKRARRKAGQQLRGGVGTRAQQAIALQREQNKRKRRGRRAGFSSADRRKKRSTGAGRSGPCASEGKGNMEQREFLDFMHVLERLKCNTLHSWTSTGRHETVAAHSWRLGVMALLLRGEFPGADMERVLRMCLIHDFGEAVTGDIPSFQKTTSDEKREERAVADMLAPLPQPVRGELEALFAEMDAMATPEARIYKALDKLEAVLQHNEAPLETWTELEYGLNLVYGEENAAEFPWLRALREELRRDTEEKTAVRAAY